MNPVCPTCGGRLQLTDRPGIEHRIGPVRAFAEPRREPGCGTGCRTDVTAAVERALRERIVIASRTRWPRAIDRCGECGTTLDLPLRATTRSVTVEAVGSPFTVTLDLPLGRCPECGCDNVPSALRDPVHRATVVAAGGAASATREVGTEAPHEARISRRRRRVGRGSPGPA